MQLPDSVKAIRSRYVAKFPIPQGPPGEQHEENCRQWSIRFAEQVAFELGPEWGMKRADPNRPISKDTIARNEGGRLVIWDLLTGTGTGTPRLAENPDGEDITGQVFVAVEAKDHLGTPAPQPVPVPAPAPAPCDLSNVLAQLASIALRLDGIERAEQATVENFASLGEQVDGLADQVKALNQKPDPKQPIAYSGALSFPRIRLTPEY